MNIVNVSIVHVQDMFICMTREGLQRPFLRKNLTLLAQYSKLFWILKVMVLARCHKNDVIESNFLNLK